MNESGALVDGYDEKSKSKDKKESTSLDIVADIGEDICNIIGSILD